MRKVNTNELDEVAWASPKGRFRGFGKQVSEALGREPASTDLLVRHPFDVEILRVPPDAAPYPFHSHSEQWEFYHVIAGSGIVRHADGTTPIVAGDAFVFRPGEPHQLTNTGAGDLVVYVIADNPLAESAYLHDSRKFIVRSPDRRIIASEAVDYFAGEE
jgi:uncharacterized cupin superfamily protein